jgi:hypothetical protein
MLLLYLLLFRAVGWRVNTLFLKLTYKVVYLILVNLCEIIGSEFSTPYNILFAHP